MRYIYLISFIIVAAFSVQLVICERHYNRAIESAKKPVDRDKFVAHSFNKQIPIVNLRDSTNLLPLKGIVTGIHFSDQYNIPGTPAKRRFVIILVRTGNNEELGLVDTLADPQEEMRIRKLKVGKAYSFPDAITSEM